MLIFLVLLLWLLPLVLSLSLDSLSVPQWVEAGSDVEMNCNYSYNQTEREELDVKWYLDGSPSPFLVWVPHQARLPQIVLDKFRSHIDIGHTVGSDPYKQHSSLLLRDVHTGLSGIYTCKVASFTQEEYLTQRMTVFVKPREFSFSVERDSSSVKLNCSAGGVLPEPTMRIFQDERTIPVSESLLVVDKDSVSVFVHSEVEQSDIGDTSLLGCTLHIPNTNYSITEQQVFRKYHRPKSLPRHSSSTPTISASFTTLLLIVCFHVFS